MVRKMKKVAQKVLKVVYYTLFIPLMMLPIVGWVVLIQLGKLSGESN
jgi:cytochrome b561